MKGLLGPNPSVSEGRAVVKIKKTSLKMESESPVKGLTRVPLM